MTAEEIRQRVEALGPWFHNLNLKGVQTAPDHFLGDYPSFKWRNFERVVPKDLSGKTVLDIGCNGGFYSIEMKRRGAARVVAIDSDEDYLAQARFASDVTGAEIELHKMSIYDVALLGEKFDLVIFMGVLYHLRHPLLALDLLHEHVVKDLLLFQSLQRGSEEVEEVEEDYPFSETAIFEKPGFPRMHFIERRYSQDPTNWWLPNRACVEAMLRSSGFEILEHPEEEVFLLPVEAVMFWNEPNNLSHWDFLIDTDWKIFSEMIRGAADAVAAEKSSLPRVLGGISPIDPAFMIRMRDLGVLPKLDAVAVHGFPLDWNHWQINEWPEKLKEIQAVTDLPVWISEIGVSTFGAEEVQEFGLRRSAELLIGAAPKIHWYSLFDLPRAWPATTRHREAEGSSYYRHFYMGLLREDGTPKRAARIFSEFTPAFGICQWFHFEDHRLETAVERLRDLGVRYLRTGLSWSDSYRPGAEAWFDKQMKLLEPFDVTLTYCFTPNSEGMREDHTSPPRDVGKFAEFCSRMTRRYV